MGADESIKGELRSYMRDFALRVLRSRKRLIEEYFREARAKYPFHTLFFPVEALVVSKLERSITAAIGTAFYTHLASIIARATYTDVRTGYRLTCNVDRGSLGRVDEILEELDRGHRTPDLEAELREAQGAADGRQARVDITADFYVGDFKEGSLMAEFKTPWPKKEDCIRSKRRLMVFRLAHTGRPHLAFIAFPYDPFGGRERFWWAAKRVFDMRREVRIAEEVWDLLGGAGTYAMLQELAKEVGEQVRREVGLFRGLTTT